MKVSIYDTTTGEIEPGTTEGTWATILLNVAPAVPGRDYWPAPLDRRTQIMDLSDPENPVPMARPDADTRTENVAAARATALEAIAAAARSVEDSEVPTAARSAIYTEKERQAQAAKAAIAAGGTPDPADYDLVRRDMIVDGLTIAQAADAILAAADRMRVIAGPLEEWRRGRNAALAAATTVSEIEALDVSVQSLMAAIAAELSP